MLKIAFLISAYTGPKRLGNMVGALAADTHWLFGGLSFCHINN